MKRSRIDTVLVERGLFSSRERARGAILAGEVRVSGQVVTKPGDAVAPDADIEVAEKRRFVSRGGDKLAGALDAFDVATEQRRAIDVGASTGGFTDCLLQRGVTSVVALDVGYGQLAWQLRNDPRVAVVERTNIRHVDPVELGAPFDIVVVDVSFISLRKILPHLEALMGPEADLVALVKPQFEVGKGRVGKKGVVRDPAAHAEVLQAACDSVRELSLIVRGITFSPITGPEGNIEFWLWVSRLGEWTADEPVSVVRSAHHALGG
jgi:23S rRNA (cytidine1920-2'-O)/16S rRNA (cytidine1409-2'-O)-methyltransferase